MGKTRQAERLLTNRDRRRAAHKIMSRDPAVAAASFGFVSHRCAKDVKAFQEQKGSSEAVKACFAKETKTLISTCGKEVNAFAECLADPESGSCSRPEWDLRVCVQSNFGFDSALEQKKQAARLSKSTVPTELPDSEKLATAASRWK